MLRAKYDGLVEERRRIGALIRAEEARGLAILQSEYGLDEDDLKRFEEARRPVPGKEYWNADIQQFPATPKLTELVAAGYERLLGLVDRNWLNEQSRLPYRLSYRDASSCRLHVVGRQRLRPQHAPTQPHRFARMLLLSRDLIDNRNDFDFFDGPMLVSEAAFLGSSFRDIDQLGDEAVRKLKSLPIMPEAEVASTVYELLVGAACVRVGRAVKMLEASKSGKTPDFQVTDQGGPFVIECKRRIGLSKFAESEARHIERLYVAAKDFFEGHHLDVEVDFKAAIGSVSESDFASVIQRLTGSADTEIASDESWGTVRLRRLPEIRLCPVTLAFSPSFLRDVFGWNHFASEWDGLLCEIDPTESPVVAAAVAPRCLKWKCTEADSIIKKARGVTSLWADAVKQIPTGESGGIYIAYEEAMRAEIGDTRTDHLLKSVWEREWYHRPLISVPWTVITRLYPQPLEKGGAELIESAIALAESGFDHMSRVFPSRVFNLSGLG